MKLVVASSMSSLVLSLTVRFALSRTKFLYFSQFVCGVWRRGAGCRSVTVVLMVAIIGVWSEERS